MSDPPRLSHVSSAGTQCHQKILIETCPFRGRIGCSCSVRALSGRVKHRACRDTTRSLSRVWITPHLEVHVPVRTTAKPMASDHPAYEPVRAALRHAPFFAALATLGGHEGEREWRALTAGLVTLRAGRPAIWQCAEDCGGLRPARDANAETADWSATGRHRSRARGRQMRWIDRDVVASPLRELARSVGEWCMASDIPHRLLAYANALHADSRWPLAADVYRTLLQFADSPRRSVVLPRLGRSCRTCMTVWDGRSA